jgi:hypothetical protein
MCTDAYLTVARRVGLRPFGTRRPLAGGFVFLQIGRRSDQADEIMKSTYFARATFADRTPATAMKCFATMAPAVWLVVFWLARTHGMDRSANAKATSFTPKRAISRLRTMHSCAQSENSIIFSSLQIFSYYAIRVTLHA